MSQDPLNERQSHEANEPENYVDMESEFWWERLQIRITRHTVSLLVFRINSDGLPKMNHFYQGSGVLVEHNGNYSLATCAHNFLEYDDKYKFIIVDRAGALDFRYKDFYSPDDVIINRPQYGPEDDLAKVKLKPDFITRNEELFFRLSRIPTTIPNACTVVACGVPGETSSTKNTFPLEIKTTATCVPGELKTDIQWSPDGTIVQNIFASIIDKSSPYFDGVSIYEAPKSFAGLSGGGLWAIMPGHQLTLLGLIREENSTQFSSISINKWLDFADS